ncbi:hypothetical protein TFLX_03588 [Thermoflexales bacterium]|nr:hypothetical protein TFLX_03588 [Thermoflexales bacterium]
MSTRTATPALSRWMLSIGLTLVALVTINLLLANAPTQARRAAALINCSGSIQACINAANDGDTILIAAGRYTESLTLSKPVSLTGENRDTTIIHAVTVQRVLTVTGSAINNSVVISGLTFTGGDATNGQGTVIAPPPTIAGPKPTPTATPAPRSQPASYSTPIPSQTSMHARAAGRTIPLSWQTRHSLQDFDPARDGVGGGILITDSARPAIQFVRVISNIGGYGGGLYFYGNQPLTLTQVDVISNVAVFGGGLMAYGPIMIVAANISNNYVVGLGGGAQISNTAVMLNSSIANNEGGGLYVEGDLTLQRTDVSFNTDRVFIGGSGITIFGGTLILNDVTIEGNHGEYWGSGIFADRSTVWITNTRIRRNSAYEGGGLRLYNGSSGRVVNSLFAQNSSSHGGASVHSWGDLQIIHTTIADTSLNSGAAIFFEIGALFITDTLIASHTIGIQRSPFATGVHEDYNLFYGNSANTSGVITGAHSLVGDPRFVDPSHDDYHLRFDSAAIDHGVDAGIYTDLDGNPRPYGTGFDIGVYEYMVGPRYVATTGHDAENDCLTETNPCATVQHAIDVANEGEQVLIASGLYTQSATLYKPVGLTGVSSDTTILHAVAGQRVLTVTGATISHSVVISGLTFTGGEADYGGAIRIDSTEDILIANARFEDNQASNGGGGVWFHGQYDLNQEWPAFTISNTFFVSNSAMVGGAIDIANAHDSEGNSTIKVLGGYFERNTAQYEGGGIWLENNPSLFVEGTTFLSNTATSDIGGEGGAISSWGGTVTLNGGFFQGNSSSASGGGLYVSGATIITNVDFIGNTAGQNGGGFVCINGTPCSLNTANTNFLGNTAGGSGGGAACNGSIILSGGQFIGNTSQESGGGLDASGASVLITGTRFLNNTASEAGYPWGLGGGLAAGEVNITNGYFKGNINLGENGGGLWAGKFIITNTDFVSNTVTGWGGGASGNEAIILGGRFERNSSGGAGGGISVNFASVSGTSFISNTSDVVNSPIGGGGAFVVIQSEVSHAHFEGNQCLATGCNGGGALLEGDSHVANTLFSNNLANGDGAAIATNAPGRHEFSHLTIAGTSFITQPAIAVLSGTLHLTNTIIASHTIAISNTAGTVTEDYNLFFNNLINTVGVTSGGRSLIGDPKFVDPLHGNYRLQFGSAAIDHGVDAGIYTDLDGNPRPFGPGFDIGACEFTGGPRYVATTGSDTGNNCLNQASPCATVQHAIDVANDGEQVLIASGLYTQSATLYKPVSLTGVSSDTAILHAVAGQRVLTVTGATISHSVVISGLTFTGGKADYGGGLLITDTARPLIRASIFVSNAASVNGGGLYAQSDLTLMDSRIVSNVAVSQGGGLYALGPNLVLTNTDFIGNVGGGAIAGDWDHLSQVNVTAGGFISNDAGLSVYGSLHMSGTQILSNTGNAPLFGAGVGIYQGTATIVNSHFENNDCSVSDCDAGGLSFYRGVVPSLVISNSVFIGNAPGGVYVHDYGQVTVTNSLFERNINTEDGGGMTLWQSSLTVTGSTFINNTGGTLGGGGIQILGEVTLINSHFGGNSSTFAGGGFYAMGNAYLTNTHFISNTADSEGGAAFVGGTAYMTDSRFERNTSGGGGGLSGGSFFITRTQFLSNTGTTVGGGIMAIGPLVANNSQFIGNQCLNVGCTGGGLYLLGYGGPGEFVNTVFARNQGHGAAMFVDAGNQVSLRHVTIADATSNVQPALVILSSTLNLTNTIIASHTIAISNMGGTVYEDYNLFFNNITNTVGVTSGGHSLIGDPKFVDLLHGNYHLQSGSAAIDHGVDAGIYTDLDGNPRPFGVGFDIGAYEFATIMYRTYLPIVLK